MKKPCKECPHFVRNRHNDMIVEFGKRTGKKHNCHMTEGKKDLWNVTDKKLECYGSITVGYICSTLTPNLKISTNLNRVLHIYLVSKRF